MIDNKTVLLGCPECGEMPSMTQVDTGLFMIRCESHPDLPVRAYGDSFIEAINEWNDNDWIRLGANEKQVSTRPRYKIDIIV